MKKPLFLLFLICELAISQITPITIMSGSLKLPGMQYKQYTFAFAQGDRIVFNYKELKNKAINKIEVFEMPSKLKFSRFKPTSISNEIITVPQTGIYVFKFTNTSLSKRVAELSIQRMPKDVSTIYFNTTPQKRIVSDTTFTTRIEKRLVKTIYETKPIIDKQQFYINSGSNAMFKGGKSRIVIPISLPVNTVEWYYTFSASRSEAEINKISSNMQLASELSQLIDQSGLLSFGIDQLTQPPGADYCDVYLIDHANYSKFINKEGFSHYPIGTRENILSGTVKVKANLPNSYLGIKNPDSMNGIHFAIEVVAIVKENIYETVEVKVPHITTQEMLFIED
ncbi:hypothetical protein [Lutibacter agarilyticus]|nr:hypothetical protein [Lutibacter agarilyticus]